MREYAVVMGVAALVTFLATPVVRWLAVRFKAMAAVRDRDVHTIPVPRMGGVGVYLGMLAAMLVAHQLPALQRTFQESSETTAVLVAGGLICLVGVLDDRFDLDPLTKFTGQLFSAGVLVLMGVQLGLVYVPFGDIGTVVLDTNTAFLLTTILVVATVNAMNFIDGLDGLLTGVAVIASLGFFVYSYTLSRSYADVVSAPTLMSAVLAGACVGFLVHNFNPARIFLGDSGSMLIGLVLASAAVSATGHADAQTFSSLRSSLPLTLPLLLPLGVLAVPLLDMVLAVIRRVGRGKSPFTPDKAHLHHRLLQIGHTQRRAVLIMYYWSALLAFAGVGVSVLPRDIVLWGCLVLVVVGIGLSAVPRLRAARRRRTAPRSPGPPGPPGAPARPPARAGTR